MSCARIISFINQQPTVNFANKYRVLQSNFTKIRMQIKSRRYGFKGQTLKSENTNTSLEVKCRKG